ncbi:MAG: late competence development ComFB family protein [Clostridiales bacterium]|nr:late competence development ComFB family protein [Clostridiales bacterium]
MPAKSSKTAHVLNLIAGEESSSDSIQDVQTPPTEKRSAVAPILEVARENDDAISNRIFTALSQDVVQEADTVSAPAAAPEATLKQEEPSLKSSGDSAVHQVSPVDMPSKADSSAPTHSDSNPKISDNFEYCNITQALVEEKALKYMKLFDMCRCPRCMADVKALALTRLPPRYIVMPKANLVPMLSFYEEKMDADLTTQLISACQMVQEHPRH